jgi:hypothetical protein
MRWNSNSCDIHQIFEVVDFQQSPTLNQDQIFDQGKNINLQAHEIPVFVDDPSQLEIL